MAMAEHHEGHRLRYVTPPNVHAAWLSTAQPAAGMHAISTHTWGTCNQLSLAALLYIIWAFTWETSVT